MSKLPLDEKQLAFIMDCLENRKMSLAQVARQIGVDSNVFYKKVAGIPQIQQYKKKITRTRKDHKKFADTLNKRNEAILFQTNGQDKIDEDYSEDFHTNAPRVITKKDMDLLEETVSNGLPMRLVAKELGIPRSTLYQYMDTNPEFAERVRKGRIRDFNKSREDLLSGKMDKSIFTFFAKTTWKDIVPQEDKHIPALPPLSLQGSLELKQTILPGKRDSQEETEEE
jgi:transposase-like protein